MVGKDHLQKNSNKIVHNIIKQMSNIYQHNFDNCFKMKLSNSDYWDLFLCYDCNNEQDNDTILSDCLLVDIDISDDNSYSGNTLYSLKSWTGSTIQGSGITLNDIGLREYAREFGLETNIGLQIEKSN